MEQVMQDIGLFPEEVEQMKAVIQKQTTIDLDCEKVSPDDTTNWQPVGGITWEERAQFMHAKLRESGKILLTSSGSLGRWPGTMELSRIDSTFHWFTDFLAKSVTLKDEYADEYRTDGRTYRAVRDSSGNVFLEDLRDGGFVSDIAFSSTEIPKILAELQNIT